MDKNVLIAEALLFASGEPVSIDQLARVLDCTQGEARTACETLKTEYDMKERGMQVVRLEKGYQMTTRPQYYPFVSALVRSAQKTVLSEAQLETLAIVAYKQPVTKSEIEDIRGVRSDAIVNKLIDYDLIRELGRKKAPGRPMLFGTTDGFLRNFGYSSLKDLPHLSQEQAEEVMQLSLDQTEEGASS